MNDDEMVIRDLVTWESELATCRRLSDWYLTSHAQKVAAQIAIQLVGSGWQTKGLSVATELRNISAAFKRAAQPLKS
jgi:hypothetical protein